MRRALGLGLLMVVLGCEAPRPLSIRAVFPLPSYETLLLNVSDGQERWFVVDGNGAGAEALPPLYLDGGGSFVLTAHLYDLPPSLVGFPKVGALEVRPDARERVIRAARAYRLVATYTSSGSWNAIEVPPAQSYPLIPGFEEQACPPFTATPIKMESATEPVAARARRQDGHFLLLTGSYGGPRPSDLRAYDLDPAQQSATEIQSPTLNDLRARQLRVGAAIEGDDGKLWLTLNGPTGRTMLWTGTLEGGGTVTATMSDSQWIRWMEWTDPDPGTGKRDLLLLSDFGQLRRYRPATRTSTLLIASGRWGACFSSSSSDPSYSLSLFCGGIARDGARGFVVTTPDRRFFRVSGLGAVTATLAVSVTEGALLPAAVNSSGAVRTMSVDQTSAFTHLFELINGTFQQVSSDISDQAPTLIIPYRDDILYGGLFGYLTKYVPKDGVHCETQAGILGGLIPTAYDPIGPDSWLLTGGSPASPKTFAVILSR